MGAGRAASQGNAAGGVVRGGGGGCAGQQARRLGLGLRLTHPLPVPSPAWEGGSEVAADTVQTSPPGSPSGGLLRCSCVPCRVLLNVSKFLPLLKNMKDLTSKYLFLA